MTFFATASGLTMDKVRSTAMQDLQMGFGKAVGNAPNVIFYQAFAVKSRFCVVPPHHRVPNLCPRHGATVVVSFLQGYIRLLQATPRTVHRVVSFLLCGVGAATLPRTFFSEHAITPSPRVRGRFACYPEV